MRAQVRFTVDRDGMAFRQMRDDSGLWLVTVNSGHIVKMVKVRASVRLDVGDCQLPTYEEVLAGDGMWLLYTRARFIRVAVRVPREKPVDEMVREFEEALLSRGHDVQKENPTA